MEIPVYHRSVRRRSICASVSVLSFDFRTSDHCYGVRGWPWKPEEYCKVFQ